ALSSGQTRSASSSLLTIEVDSFRLLVPNQCDSSGRGLQDVARPIRSRHPLPVAYYAVEARSIQAKSPRIGLLGPAAILVAAPAGRLDAIGSALSASDHAGHNPGLSPARTGVGRCQNGSGGPPRRLLEAMQAIDEIRMTQAYVVRYGRMRF